MPSSSFSTDGSDQTRQIARVVDEFVDRRLAGDRVSDEAIIAKHPELMPELAERLRDLQRIENARQNVEQDLAATVRAEADRLGARQTPAADEASDESASSPQADSIPGYQVLREIHRGGQGVVYQAIQRSTKRKVAIKVIRGGPFASATDIARFDREVQILGQLRHPNIVAIHDSGSAAGSHFFVMDYIPGRPLDAYAAEHPQPVRESLQLFVKICDAVHAAHIQGIIHRDLKPGNIRIDSSGEPHVLDFGLARIATGAFTDESRPQVMTVTGQFVGSLPWASPEQAEGRPEIIDLRTDVYSLGVMLYQLLTGCFPYEVVGDMRVVLENILHSEPVRPRSHSRQIDDEVETIVLKCLNKDRERRYQSAGELARDIRHYLAGEPIDAKRDSAWYVLRKTMRRYRLAVSVALVFVLMVMGFGAVMTVLYSRAVVAEQLAQDRLAAARTARAQEAEQRSVAERQAEKALRVQEFLQGMLSSVSPETAQGRDVTILRELLDNAARRIEAELADQPEAEAAVQETIGNTYYSIGLYDPAEAPLRAALALQRAALGNQPAPVARALSSLGRLLYAKADYDAAELLYRKALALQRGLPEEQQAGIVTSLNGLGAALFVRGDFEAAKATLKEALYLGRQRHGNEHREVATSMENLAVLEQARGNYDAAERLFREALAVQQTLAGELPSAEVAAALANLAVLLRVTGQYAPAEALYREALKVRRQLLGEEHPAIASSLSSLGNLLRVLGKHEEAERLLRDALAMNRKLLGEEHSETGIALNNLGLALQAKRDYAAAEPMLRKSLEIQRKLLGERSPDVALGLNNLAALMADMRRLDEAERLHREALAMRRALLGENHSSVGASLNNLAIVLDRKGDKVGAVQAFREALAIVRDQLGDDHPHVGATLYGIGRALCERGDYAAAEPALRESLSNRRGNLPAGHYRIGSSSSQLGVCLVGLKRYDEAEPLLESGFEIIRAARGEMDRRTIRALKRLIKLYEEWGRPDDAGKYRALLEPGPG